LQIWRAYKSAYETPTPVFISIEDRRGILGEGLHEKRLTELIRDGYIERVTENNIYGRGAVHKFVPLITTYTKSKSKNNFMENYYARKTKSLSPVAKKIFMTLKKTQIEVTKQEVVDAVKGDRDRAELIYNEIQEFNSHKGNQKLDYISEDDFGNRLHTIITRLPKSIRRNNLKIRGEGTVEIDLVQSQPEILGKLLQQEIGNNLFSSFVASNDIYLYIESKMKLKCRREAKKAFYVAMFGKLGNRREKQLIKLFPDLGDWIDRTKSNRIKGNPSKELHSNIAYLLQRKESFIFRMIWGKMYKDRIPLLTVHDSIIVRESDLHKAVHKFTRLLSLHIHSNVSTTVN